jgi:hypothetical protein
LHRPDGFAVQGCSGQHDVHLADPVNLVHGGIHGSHILRTVGGRLKDRRYRLGHLRAVLDGGHRVGLAIQRAVGYQAEHSDDTVMPVEQDPILAICVLLHKHDRRRRPPHLNACHQFRHHIVAEVAEVVERDRFGYHVPHPKLPLGCHAGCGQMGKK